MQSLAKPSLFLSITLLIGVAAVVVSVVFGTEYFRFIKPLFHIFLFAYFLMESRKMNYLLLIFFISTMIAEFLAATNFTAYFTWIALLFTSYFVMGTAMVYPVWKVTKASFMGIDKIATLLVVLILGYIIISMFMISAQELKEHLIFGVATLSFTAFIGSCLFVAAFHKNPRKLNLFVVGAGYVLICVGSLIYELQYNSVYILGMVNLTEVIAQFAFVSFILHREKLLQQQNWFL